MSTRTLAISAVFALTIPALAAAAPIVAPPEPETLVEGHTVFTVITRYSEVGEVPIDLDLNVSLDLEVFSNLTVDLCIKTQDPAQNSKVNGTVTDEEQVNATGSAQDDELVNESTGPIHPIPSAQPTQPTAPTVWPRPPRDETCTTPRRPNTTFVTETFAAAVAVLVREYNPNNFDKLFINATVDLNADVNETVNAEVDACTDTLVSLFPCVRRGNRGQWSRFPGVLWFNDQYLVGPHSRIGSDDADGDPFGTGWLGPLGPDTGGPAGHREEICADIPYTQVPPAPEIPCDPNGVDRYRYPCGGAIMAVRRDQPDPREVILNVRNSPVDRDLDGDGDGDIEGSHPVFPQGGDLSEGSSNETGASSDSGDFAWIGLDAGSGEVETTGIPSQSTTVGQTTVHPAIDYVESYLITDPNDHSWTIDLYRARTQRSFAGGVLTETQQSFFVWVVNTLGGPHFVPDDGTLNCLPFEDWMPQQVEDELDALGCERLRDDLEAPANLPNSRLTPRDDPCSGYKEPSDGAVPYCYGGQPAIDADGDSDVDATDCRMTRASSTPLRLYNGLLYFRSQQLGAMDGDLTHDPATSTHTNGCHPGSEWVCPAGSDDAEGNSHPFHPDAHPLNADTQPCPKDGSYGFTDNAGGNHGGSATPTDTDEPHNNECDFRHATWDVDIYFSPNGRPFPPRQRSFAVEDVQGSDAPFSQTEQPGHP